MPGNLLRYFAYGSNMDAEQMKNRCPTAQYLGQAVLSGYRFQIDSRGVATVIKDTNSSVYGIVWQLADGNVSSLDAYEGVPKFYVRLVCPVVFDSEAEPMLVYSSTDTGRGVGRKGYMEKVVAAAECAGFPDSYLQELRWWLIAKDF